MTNPKSRIIAAVVGALSMGATAAWAVEPAQDVQIKELQAKVAALEAKQASSSKEMAATIDAVLRDAEKRSQLLANGADMGAGYDNGFFIRAGDSWVLRPGAQFQFRHVVNFREDVDDQGGDNDDEFTNGFEVRRMKLSLEGTAFTRDLTYKFQWATEEDGGGLQLEDAWVRYMFADDWGLRAGQFKDPVHHEELTSSKYQLAADRSMVNEFIGGGLTGYTQGVTLIYGGYNKNNPLNVEVGLTDGAGQANTNFQDSGLGLADGVINVGDNVIESVDWGAAARVEYKAMGDWRAYRDFSAMGNKEDLLVLGAGADWTQAGDGDLLFGTIDAQYEMTNGLGLYGALLVTHLESDLVDEIVGGENNDFTAWGGLVQAGYMLSPSWELFGRYDFVVSDEEVQFGDGDEEDFFHEVTLGVNYFLGSNGSAGHRAKITVDVTWLPNGSPAALEGAGILDANGGDNEFILRGQFQLLI